MLSRVVFPVGTRVRFYPPGGPEMLVVDTIPDAALPKAVCAWIDESGEVREFPVPTVCLDQVRDY